MTKRTILAPLLILLGAYLLLNQGGTVGAGSIFATFWPTLFVIPLGLFFTGCTSRWLDDRVSDC